MDIQLYGLEPAWQFNLDIGTAVRLIAKNLTNLKSNIDPMIRNHIRDHGYIDGIVTGYIEGQQTICISTWVSNPLNDNTSMLPSVKEMTMRLRIEDFTNNDLQFVELVASDNK